MKRLIAAALLVLLLCGCAGEKIEANENCFLIRFRNNCGCEIYGVHLEYYLADKPIGGGFAGYANGEAIRYDDILTRDFIPADFPSDPDLTALRIEVYIVDGQQQEYLCPEIPELDAAWGNTYEIILTGNYESGFHAAWKEN